jgi:hypothetical protein
MNPTKVSNYQEQDTNKRKQKIHRTSTIGSNTDINSL